MILPSSTYRLQLNARFTFIDALNILDYLRELGVSTLYLSPVFAARDGSDHGYNIIDPSRLNPEIGDDASLARLRSEMAARGLGWLQDIVPNHMAYDGRNLPLVDVLENGDASPYAGFFDIDWDHPYDHLRGKVLAPFLGKFYGEALESGEITLACGDGGLVISYYDLALPLKIESYAQVIGRDLNRLQSETGAEHPDYVRLLGILYALKDVELNLSPGPRAPSVASIKRMLAELYDSSEPFRRHMDRNIAAFNGKPGCPESWDQLDRLLAEQRFRLAFWKVASEELNYRRFFIINDLISLREENKDVFEFLHAFPLSLMDRGCITALRVDHIDGLYDPLVYLRTLRGRAGDAPIWVEKILASGEQLPPEWPVQGTTGYDFLNQVNGIFCDASAEHKMDRTYHRVLGYPPGYDNLIFEKKQLIIGKYMAGDINELAQMIKRCSSSDRHGTDITLYGLQRAMIDLMALFPVYRTYINREGVRASCREIIERVLAMARETNPGLTYEIGFIGKFLLQDYPASLSDDEKRQWLHFTMRFQQYTGPLMAKGFEDTVLFVFNRLLSLNEVGGDPGRFGVTVEDFHAFNLRRMAAWPFSLNATATHDTKRGEDARSRLNVLSELPDEWRSKVRQWIHLNAAHKSNVNGRESPGRNDEYHFYQTLLGSYPLDREELDGYAERIKSYLIKAVREAKVYTAWLKPDEAYEQAFLGFAEAVLDRGEGNDFLKSFVPFQEKISFYGMINSLAQTVLKLTAPGIPDIYQGTELWDFSLLDPDNRRPVNYAARISLLDELLRLENSGPVADLAADLWNTRKTGKIKLYLIRKLLSHRRAHAELFLQGNYIPLTAGGKHKGHIVAFARALPSGRWHITVAPRFCTRLVQPPFMPAGPGVWDDTIVNLPPGAPAAYDDIFTGMSVTARNSALPAGEILQHFPVSALVSR